MEGDLGVYGAPVAVWLHPHRGAGACYAALGAVVLVVDWLSVVKYVSSGQFLLAFAAIVGGLVVVSLLGVLALALLVPGLDVRAAGVTGWLAVGRRVDVGWDEVRIDLSEQVSRGRLRLDVTDDSVELDLHSWAGFSEFILLVSTTPDAARRLTPAARREVARLLNQ